MKSHDQSRHEEAGQDERLQLKCFSVSLSTFDGRGLPQSMFHVLAVDAAYAVSEVIRKLEGKDLKNLEIRVLEHFGPIIIEQSK